jgi:hypothetical protein
LFWSPFKLEAGIESEKPPEAMLVLAACILELETYRED